MVNMRIIIGILLIVSANSVVHAASPKDEYEAVQEELAKARKNERKLAQTTQKLEEEQNAISRQLVKLASKLQHNEKDLTLTEEKLEILTHQLDTKNAELAEQRTQLAAMMAAGIRLSQMPPEAAIMMPGDPAKIIEAARAVELMANSIHQHSIALAEQMKELEDLREKVEISREELQQAQESLVHNQQSLNEKLKERAELYARVDDDYTRQKKRSTELAKKSESMQALMEKLEAERKAKTQAQAEAKRAEAEKEAEKTIPQIPPERTSGKLRSFADAKGKIRLPVAGKLLKQYGDASKRGERRKGIILQARSAAHVTAPFDGEVVFTGPFLNYGKIVIIRHSNDFHTLLAGLETIQTQTGKTVSEGEPVGIMGDSKVDSQLYLELRRNNQPINPEPWIRGLAGE